MNDEHCRRGGNERLKLMFIDVKKTHLKGFLKEDAFAYIELPPEARAEGRCGRLRRWIYGMRPAASAWEADYAEKLSGIGFVEVVLRLPYSTARSRR